MNLIEFTLTTTDWGKVKMARPDFGSIKTDPWGGLAVLKGTPWELRIPIIPGEVMSHALHGRATPLMRVIGAPPHAHMKQIPDPYRICAMCKQCILFRKEDCNPGPKIPECYIPPGLSPAAQLAAALVVLAWKENRYVVVVQGDEFNL